MRCLCCPDTGLAHPSSPLGTTLRHFGPSLIRKCAPSSPKWRRRRVRSGLRAALVARVGAVTAPGGVPSGRSAIAAGWPERPAGGPAVPHLIVLVSPCGRCRRWSSVGRQRNQGLTHRGYIAQHGTPGARYIAPPASDGDARRSNPPLHVPPRVGRPGQAEQHAGVRRRLHVPRSNQAASAGRHGVRPTDLQQLRGAGHLPARLGLEASKTTCKPSSVPQSNRGDGHPSTATVTRHL